MRYVVIGSSAAGTAAARSIRKADPSGSITMVSKDARIFSRCQLHLVAAGRRTHDQACFVPENWATRERIDLRYKTTVTALDPKDRTILLEGGEALPYDRLLIATGARTWSPPIAGLAGPRTFGLRDLQDADNIYNSLSSTSRCAIIGAGLVGCELAAALSKEAKEVHLIELAPWPLPMQLDASMGARCAALLEENRIHLHCGRKVTGVKRSPDNNPEAILLDDGTAIQTGLVAAAAGVRPNVEWLEGSGLELDPKGILINERGETNLKDVYAAGDVTVMEDILLREVIPSAIWPTAIRQGRVAGSNMTGGNQSLKRNTGFRASVHLLGTNIVSLGPVARPEPTWEKQEITYTSSRGQVCSKTLYFDSNYLRAAILWGDITDAGVYTEAIINRRPLPKERTYAACLDGAKQGDEAKSIL